MKMSWVIVLLVIISGIFLLCVLVFLAYLNWSYKVQASLISITLVGTGTVLVTIFSGLKDQVVIERFVTTVFVNDTTARYAVFPDEKSKIHGRSAILNQYSDQATIGVKDGTAIWVDKYPIPSNDEDWFDFNREAFTYDLFKTIWVLSNSGAAYDYSGGIGAIGILKIDLPNDCTPLKYKSIVSNFEKFHGVEIEGILLTSNEFFSINVPSNTHISMYSVKEKDHFPVSILEFKKDLYFDIKFKVTRITNPNYSIPTKLLDRKINTKKLRSYSYMIEMSSNFSKYSSSGDKSSQYVLWCNSLFSTLKQKYDDTNL